MWEFRDFSPVGEAGGAKPFPKTPNPKHSLIPTLPPPQSLFPNPKSGSGTVGILGIPGFPHLLERLEAEEEAECSRGVSLPVLPALPAFPEFPVSMSTSLRDRGTGSARRERRSSSRPFSDSERPRRTSARQLPGTGKIPEFRQKTPGLQAKIPRNYGRNTRMQRETPGSGTARPGSC